MSFAAFLTIVLSVTVSAIGQIFLKIGLNSLSKLPTPEHLTGQLTTLWLTLITPGVIAGLGLYAAGALIWLSALARVEISQAYPFVGIGFVLTTLAGWWIFGDHLSMQRVAGIGVILVGVAILART